MSPATDISGHVRRRQRSSLLDAGIGPLLPPDDDLADQFDKPVDDGYGKASPSSSSGPCLTRGEAVGRNSGTARLEAARPWEVQIAAAILGVR